MFLSSVILLGGLAVGEAAEEPPPPPPPRSSVNAFGQTVAVMGQVGFGTPTGYYGVALELAPIPELVASLGVGLGSGPYCKARDAQPGSFDAVCARWHRDVQVAVQGRYRVVARGNSALALGGGYSTGGYTWVEFTTDGPAYKTTERAHWTNVEASWEGRHESGFSARLFLGYAWMLNPSSLGCVGWGAGSSSFGHCTTGHAGDGHRLLYLGAAVGWAFR